MPNTCSAAEFPFPPLWDDARGYRGVQSACNFSPRVRDVTARVRVDVGCGSLVEERSRGGGICG
ncbi:predicted protein [Plenodomus lingam JN3]|uniref:Uncharacterized protein n=1 Tax=Leptosphaeria maculans (strain JN3 / isolate v23.1.3 / race Av1-4-5-6-7-8) TaxID=985895 RepID=E4ZG39_LEPMJ|nr:predicted protein [Plenodomus lingam JN3]CBX90259.1 predicted protein [Plenodomus lingam JN3]